MKLDIRELWAAMKAHPMGPEPIILEIDDEQINISTLSCLNEDGNDGLYASGRGETLEEAVKKFIEDLENEIGNCKFEEDES